MGAACARSAAVVRSRQVTALGTTHARDKLRASDALISLAPHCRASCRSNAHVARVLGVQDAHSAPTTRDRAPVAPGGVAGPSEAPQAPQIGSGFDCMAAPAEP